MNFFSIGYQCYNAQCLGWLGLRKESLLFDFLKSPLPKVYEILCSINKTDFCVDSFVKNFLKTDSTGFNPPFNKDTKVAIYSSFYMGHFIEYRKGIFEPTEEIKEAFKRRIPRTKDRFYNESNILIYNDIEVKNDSIAEEYIQYIPKILELNPNNSALVILHKDRQFNVGTKNITYEYIEADQKSKDYGANARGKIVNIFKERFIKTNESFNVTAV